MSHIPDMTPGRGRRVPIGWLHPDHPFSRGIAPPEFVARLTEFAHNWGWSIKALGWGAAGGFHECEFCRIESTPLIIGKNMASGSFGVPANDRIYYCPEMIAHYVADHGYLPPPEFIAAVMACPIPGTTDYINRTVSHIPPVD